MTEKPTTEPHLTSHEHRDTARRLASRTIPFDAVDGLHREEMRRLARAQVHATLAVHEALYELLGDDSKVDRAATLGIATDFGQVPQ